MDYKKLSKIFDTKDEIVSFIKVNRTDLLGEQNSILKFRELLKNNGFGLQDNYIWHEGTPIARYKDFITQPERYL